MSTAAVDRRTALFVRETADKRFRFGSATADGGAVMTTCTTSPGDTPFSARPAIVPLVTLGINDQHHVIGADRETVLSVTCNGTPLALRPLPPFVDGRRRLSAFDLPVRTGGRVTVTVSRPHAMTTEHVRLLWHRAQSHPSCD
ncbi:hypothetical protein ABZ153_00465 [Streptomyces sp. NPDC006290]|uniref:hypothetical protein n=1 Tax=Streptomyces sp. NPDC006290 TaxID=3156745 RepID=UPI0033B218C4